MFVQEFSFTITEHDLEERWIVVGTERHTIKLDDGESFLDVGR